MHTDFTEDEALWLKIREGDRDAFEVLYKRLFGLLYKYGCKLSSSFLVKDAIHDLFLSIWHSREKLYATTSVRFYLFTSLKRRLVRNNAKDNKSAFFDFNTEQVFLQTGYSQEDIMIERESLDLKIVRLKKHLQDLPPRQYEALILRFYNELSYEEIASVLKVNDQSARNLIQRALELLRKYAQIKIPMYLLLLSYSSHYIYGICLFKG